MKMSKELLLGFGGLMLLLMTSTIKGNVARKLDLERRLDLTLRNETLKPVLTLETNVTRFEDQSALLSDLLPTPFDVDAEEFAGTVGDGAFPRITYDQRQSGKYNVHIVIKDVAIIEMDRNQVDDYMGNDYYYDEADLTVKPLPLHQLTTSSPDLTTTTTTSPATEAIPIKTTTPKSLVSSPGINTNRSSSKMKPAYALYSLGQDHDDVKITSSSPKVFKLRVHRPHHKTQAESSSPSVLKRMLREQHAAYHQRRCRSNRNCQPLKLGRSSSRDVLLNRLLHYLMKLPFVSSSEDTTINED